MKIGVVNMECNIELLYKTIEAQIENDLLLTECKFVSYEAKERYSYEIYILRLVLSMIENKDSLERTAEIYGVI